MAVSDTLRGYRTQFLYTLYRIISTNNSGKEVFRPEGIEDLDILVDDKVVESIQVKNHKSSLLGYAHLSSNAHTTSFFSRGINTLRKYPQAKLTLFSFYVVDDDLSQKPRLSYKLKHDKYTKFSTNDINSLLNAYEIKIRSEQSLYEEVVAILKQRFPSFNPEYEIKLLTQWIYNAAEEGKKLTYNDLVNVRERYVTFNNQQASVLSEYGLTVIKLDQVPGICQDNIKEEFYNGVSARLYHIQAGLDVKREQKLLQIKNAFMNSNVVILHGQSGQGKSTLAYRYINDYCPFAYEIRNSNDGNISRIIATLSALAKDLPWKIVLYLDVIPSNTEWVQIVKEFANYEKVQCIITIRQEDWNQKKNEVITNNSTISEIEVTLIKEEAHKIYEAIKSDDRYPFPLPFEDVWKKEGKQGSLLEFIYFLNHGRSLKSRIAEQVEKITDKSRDLLAYIALGNHLGGHINKYSLSDLTKLSILEVERLVKNWNKEYFVINEDGEFSDVHPIRTKLIIDQIFNNDVKIIVRYGLNLYKLVNPNQTDIYLIRLMNEGMSACDLIDWETNQRQLTPALYHGIAKALLWKRIKEYEEKHKGLIDQLKNKVGTAWNWYLPFNFTEIDIQESVEKLVKTINNDIPDLSYITNRFEPQSIVFEYIERWLCDKELCLSIKSGQDWLKAGEFLYIVSQLSITPKIEIGTLPFKETGSSLSEMSTILLGFKLYNYSDENIADIEKSFINNLRHQYNIVNFEIDDDRLHIVSFLDYFNNHDDESRAGFITEQHNMAILELCRRAFPKIKVYNSKIIDDTITSFLPTMPTEKSIPRDKFPLYEMTEYCTILSRLYQRSYLLPDRLAYADTCILLRKRYAKTVYEVALSIEKWSCDKSRNNSLLADAYKQASDLIASSIIEIPKSEISEYGLDYKSDETYIPDDLYTHKNKKKTDIEEVQNLISTHISSLNTFFIQSLSLLIGEHNNNYKRTSIANLYEAINQLYKLQTMFKRVLGEYVNKKDLESVEKAEKVNLKMLWVIWEAYISNNGTKLNCANLMRRFDFKEKNLTNEILKVLNTYLSDHSSQKKASYYGLSIKIDCKYEDIEAKADIVIECIDALQNTFSNYAYFSSERLIMGRKVKEVWINPLYCCNVHDDSNLDLHYTSMSINRFFEIEEDDNLESSSYPQYDADKDAYNLCPKVRDYNTIMAQLFDMVMTTHKITSAIQFVTDDDKVGSEVIKDYADKSKERFLENKVINILSYRVSLQTSDNAVNNDIGKLLDAIESFYSLLNINDEWWLTCQDCIESYLDVIANDWMIKACLTMNYHVN
jgi:hypothetical protein